MRRAILSTAAFVGLGLASVASAAPVRFGGFEVEHRRIPGTGANAGFDIVQFFAKNLGTGGQTGTTRLLATDLQVNSNNDEMFPATAAAVLKFDFRDLDGDGTPDANVLGAQLPLNPTAANQGSYVRVGGLNSVTVPPGDAGFDPAPPARFSDNDGDGAPDNDPAADFANRKTFRVVLFNTTAPDATAAANGGLGAFFAQAVVPTNASPRVVGGIAAEQGPSVPIDYTAAIPEPTTLGLLTLGAMGLLGRRRRA